MQLKRAQITEKAPEVMHFAVEPHRYLVALIVLCDSFSKVIDRSLANISTNRLSKFQEKNRIFGAFYVALVIIFEAV